MREERRNFGIGIGIAGGIEDADRGQTSHDAPWISPGCPPSTGDPPYFFVARTVTVGLPERTSTSSCAAHLLFPHFVSIVPSTDWRIIQFPHAGHRRSLPVLSGIFFVSQRKKLRAFPRAAFPPSTGDPPNLFITVCMVVALMSSGNRILPTRREGASVP